MTNKEIEQKINEDYQNFMNAKYSGHIAIPENIIELFKRGIMSMPPFAHKLNFNKVKSIISKDVDSLTNSDLTDIIKVVLNIAPDKLYDDIYEAIDNQLKMEKFIISYNNLVDDTKVALQKKSEMYQKLSGGKNGMRIIPTGNA